MQTLDIVSSVNIVFGTAKHDAAAAPECHVKDSLVVLNLVDYSSDMVPPLLNLLLRLVLGH